MKIYWNEKTHSKNRIGRRVSELRRERQLTEAALAELLQNAGYHFSELTVIRIEQGKRFVPDYEMVAIAQIFQVSCEYLLGMKKDR